MHEGGDLLARQDGVPFERVGYTPHGCPVAPRQVARFGAEPLRHSVPADSPAKTLAMACAADSAA